MDSPALWFKNRDAHHRLLLSGAVAVAVWILTMGWWRLPVQMVMVWNAFGVCLLALDWVQIVTGVPAEYLSSARLQDSSRTTIFLAVLTAACMSVFAVFYLLGSAHDLDNRHLTAHVVLSIATVVCSWAMIHTLFTLRYAHLYYGEGGGAEGVDFPDEKQPDYLDFAYFSFVIGMTCQVSDVQITGRRIRRLALLHGLVSFAFNTAILALGINIVSGLLAK